MQHSSVAQASLCTAKVIRAYFGNGTLPAPGTVCDVHVPLFAGTDGWGEVVADLVAGGNATANKRGIADQWESARRLVGPKLPKRLVMGV